VAGVIYGIWYVVCGGCICLTSSSIAPVSSALLRPVRVTTSTEGEAVGPDSVCRDVCVCVCGCGCVGVGVDVGAGRGGREKRERRQGGKG
jgi:hypothetical protein